LNPCLVDVDAFALQNIYETNYEVDDECIALVDIGAVKTSINVLKGTDSLFMRDVSLGCSQVNNKIIDQTNCSRVEAEEIKLSEKEDNISHEDLAEIISSVVADWTTEIRRALDFFYSTYPDERIKTIVLSGGGANIKEFQQLLTSQTSTDVKVIDPFKNIDIEGANVDSAYLGQVAPQAAICAGLAIRRVDDK
ncbi:MAG: pilus assembly protein PilM, partial [Desulfobacteraceae bacterium]|nr:pilus assembly protein PilM [Desulfobacteraceae bacterium]